MQTNTFQSQKGFKTNETDFQDDVLKQRILKSG